MHELTAARGAQFRDDHGWQLPAHYGAPDEEYRLLREDAGLLDLFGRGKILATGEDRVRWLHGMVTNDVKSRQPGQGCYCFVLTAQGHIVADLQVLVGSEGILLDCEPFLTEKLVATLDHYIIMDQVELADLTPTLGTIGVEGPRAAEVVRSALGFGELPQNPLDHVPYGEPGSHRLVAHAGRGFWILAPVAELADLWGRLESAGARPAGFAAWDVIRIESGVPRCGVEIGETTLPQETGQMRALNFDKGCYVGQEIVERIRSRGHVNQLLLGLRAERGELKPGQRVEADGKEIGRITSAARSPALGCPIALAYLRREFAEPGRQVMVEGQPAQVSALPFV